jgi:hypothetical protein
VSAPDARSISKRRERLAGNPASAIYGTVVVAGLLVAEAATDTSIPVVIGSILVTLVVFWVAHAYSQLLGLGVTANRSWWASFRFELRHEWPIVESAFVPIAALVLSRFVGVDRSRSFLIASLFAVLELAAWASLACRRQGMATAQRLRYVAAALALGGIVIALKALTSH